MYNCPYIQSYTLVYNMKTAIKPKNFQFTASIWNDSQYLFVHLFSD